MSCENETALEQGNLCMYQLPVKLSLVCYSVVTGVC